MNFGAGASAAIANFNYQDALHRAEIRTRRFIPPAMIGFDNQSRIAEVGELPVNERHSNFTQFPDL